MVLMLIRILALDFALQIALTALPLLEEEICTEILWQEHANRNVFSLWLGLIPKRGTVKAFVRPCRFQHTHKTSTCAAWQQWTVQQLQAWLSGTIKPEVVWETVLKENSVILWTVIASHDVQAQQSLWPNITTETNQLESTCASQCVHPCLDSLETMARTYVSLNALLHTTATKLENDHALINAQLFQTFITTLKTIQGSVWLFAKLEHGEDSPADNVSKILLYVDLNGPTISPTCVLLLVLPPVVFTPIPQLDSACLSVLPITTLMRAPEPVSKDVLPLMDHWVLLQIMPPEFARRIAKNPMLLLILRPETGTVFCFAPKTPMKPSLILQRRLVSADVQFFQAFLPRLKDSSV
jgi:hypothetical protein